MRHHTGLALASVIAFSLCGLGAASAADMAVKARPAMVVDPAYNWTGFYIGLNAGYGWNDDHDVAISGSPLITGSQPATVPFALGLRPEGWLAGGQIGYNYQVGGRWVLGVEADFAWADIADSNFIDLPPGPGATVRTSVSEKIDFFGTVRGRLGVTFDRLLVYGTGGLAYANVKQFGNIDEFFFGGGRQFIANSSDLRYGWTVGAGAEWAVSKNWSVKAEYLYYDLGSNTITGPQSNPVNGIDFATYSFSTRGSIARGGLNYKFDWGAPVVARY
ncbi:MAG: outer membrane protein [Pseudomonadota bacterium]